MIALLGLIMLVVEDLDRSVAFYERLFGLELTFRSLRWAELDAGNIRLGLHLGDHDVRVNPATGCSFAFYVDDVNRATADVAACGGSILHEPHDEEFGGSVSVITDPDGYRIHLLELPTTA